MKNRRNRFLAFGMGCVLGFSCVFSSYATNADLKDAKNKMSSLQEEKKKVQDTLRPEIRCSGLCKRAGYKTDFPGCRIEPIGEGYFGKGKPD